MSNAHNPDLKWIISKASEGEAKYADLRMQDMHRKILIAENGQEVYENTQHLKGVGIRILLDSCWGFSFTNRLDRTHLLECLEDARKNSYIKGAGLVKETKAVQTKRRSQFKFHPSNISDDEKMNFLSLLSMRLKNICPQIRNAQVLYKEVFGNKTIVTSNGTFIELETISLGLLIWIAFKARGKIMTYSRDIVDYKGYEALKRVNVDKLVIEIVNEVTNLSNARGFGSKKYKVLLDPSTTGILIHETIGHLSEADVTLAGSVFSKRQGQLVASKELSVLDIGVIDGGVWFPYDDEGVRKTKTSIIENGILKQFIHSKETAAHFQVQPTGNARAESYMYPPLVRQTNTCTEPGDMEVEELLSEINEGLFIQSGRSGNWRRNGDFSVLAQSAQRIKKKELGDYTISVKLKGNLTKLLHSVSGLSKETNTKIGFFEGCNKENQMIPHGIRAPYMLILEAQIEPVYSLPWIDLTTEYQKIGKENT